MMLLASSWWWENGHCLTLANKPRTQNYKGKNQDFLVLIEERCWTAGKNSDNQVSSRRQKGKARKSLCYKGKDKERVGGGRGVCPRGKRRQHVRQRTTPNESRALSSYQTYRSSRISNGQNMTQVGVPIRLLHEGEGHIVSIELRNGIDALEIAIIPPVSLIC